MVYLLSRCATLCQVLFPLHPLVLDQKAPVSLFGPRHEQGPTFYCGVKFHSMIRVGAGGAKTARAAPLGNLAHLLTVWVKLRAPFPVAASKDKCGKGPRMVMQVVGVWLEKLVYKDVERKSISIFEEHIVAFQIRFVVHSVHDNTVPTQALKEFFKHTAIIQDYE